MATAENIKIPLADLQRLWAIDEFVRRHNRKPQVHGSDAVELQALIVSAPDNEAELQQTSPDWDIFWLHVGYTHFASNTEDENPSRPAEPSIKELTFNWAINEFFKQNGRMPSVDGSDFSELLALEEQAKTEEGKLKKFAVEWNMVKDHPEYVHFLIREGYVTAEGYESYFTELDPNESEQNSISQT